MAKEVPVEPGLIGSGARVEEEEKDIEGACSTCFEGFRGAFLYFARSGCYGNFE
jgi:hypothetical protein